VADFRHETTAEDGGTSMRISILAGLILGTSLAIQSMVVAHAKANVVHPASAVHEHVRVVAPWYIAANDGSTAVVRDETQPGRGMLGA
jgi:hypothetical protein